MYSRNGWVGVNYGIRDIWATLVSTTALLALTACGSSQESLDPQACPQNPGPNVLVIKGAAEVQASSMLKHWPGSIVVCELEADASLAELVEAGSLAVLGARNPVRGGSSNAALSLPLLERLRTSLDTRGHAAVHAPALSSVPNVNLLAATLSGVTEFASLVDANHVASTETLRLPVLETVSRLQAALLVAPALRHTDSLSLGSSGTGTGAVSLPSLETCETLDSGPGMATALELPRLTSLQRISVYQQRRLHTISVPALVNLNELIIYDNPELAQCVVDELVQRTGATVLGRRGGNNGTGECL